MRILLTSHVPPGHSDARWDIAAWAAELTSAGHQPRLLIVDRTDQGAEPYSVRRVVCREGDANADLVLDLPCFSPEEPRRQVFSDLTDVQLSRYREMLRKALDNEVDTFNPHLIHADAVWIWGHLALETGAAYVLSASSLELAARRADPRFVRLADEAAENAGRILAADEPTRQEIVATFDVPAERVIVLPLGATGQVEAVYREVLVERYGRVPAW